MGLFPLNIYLRVPGYSTNYLIGYQVAAALIIIIIVIRERMKLGTSICYADWTWWLLAYAS